MAFETRSQGWKQCFCKTDFSLCRISCALPDATRVTVGEEIHTRDFGLGIDQNVPKDGQGCRKSLFNRNEGAHALALLTVWCEKFYTCATLCFGKRLCFFPLTPKLQLLLHVAADVKEQLSRMQSTDRYILNPGLFATQMVEDATGRSCRMARTCHVLTASVRVARKWLIAIKLFWDEQAEQDDA